MITTHTLGPWVLGDENNQCCSVLLGNVHNLTCSIDRQDGNTGAFVIERDEMLANARLIAAAPELLEALIAIAEFIPNTSASEGGAARHSKNVIAADMVRAAIAKATGAA